MAFDIEGARKAGYSDAEIADQLSQRFGFDLAGAKSAGYSDGEVIAQLAKRPAPVRIPGQMDRPEPAAQPGVMDKIIGAGDAATTTLLNMAGGGVGMAAGAAAGLGKALYDKATGKPWNPNTVEDMAAKGAQFLTAPAATEEGQRQADAIGSALAQTIPAAAALPGLRMPPGAVPAAAQALRTGAAATLDTARTAIPAAIREAPSRVAAAVSRAPTGGATPGTLGSVGAAGTDMAMQRTQAANSLPQPVRLTTGQASRNFEQLRFEKETAKDPRTGAPLRDFGEQQNADLLANFDRFVDATGAQAPDVVAAGRSVVGAVVKDAAKAKTEIRVAYKAAEKAGETAELVPYSEVSKYIGEQSPTTRAKLAPILDVVAEQLAANDPNGTGLISIRGLEDIRKAINKNTEFGTPNSVYGGEMKTLIDAATEGKGGELYRTARGLRIKYADKFENRAVIANLIENRKGMADPKTAIDKVFQRSILQGSPDDVLFLRRTLRAGGEDGQQAWREMQGATLRHIQAEATRGVSTDQRGNPVISPAGLNSAVTALDKNGRLPLIFGKQGAQQLRDINDIAKVINTAPPGAINSSNTASVLIAALTEAGVTGSMTGIPLPLMSGIRAIAVHVKDRRVQARVQSAIRNETLRQQRATPKQAPNNAPADPVELPGQPGPTVH